MANNKKLDRRCFLKRLGRGTAAAMGFAHFVPAAALGMT
jgi:hypothetical protein